MLSVIFCLCRNSIFCLAALNFFEYLNQIFSPRNLTCIIINVPAGKLRSVVSAFKVMNTFKFLSQACCLEIPREKKALETDLQ